MMPSIEGSSYSPSLGSSTKFTGAVNNSTKMSLNNGRMIMG